MTEAKYEWVILMVSAGTDLVVTAGTAIMAAEYVTKTVVAIAFIGGVVAMARTIQQALRSNVLLRGNDGPKPVPPTPPKAD